MRTATTALSARPSRRPRCGPAAGVPSRRSTRTSAVRERRPAVPAGRRCRSSSFPGNGSPPAIRRSTILRSAPSWMERDRASGREPSCVRHNSSLTMTAGVAPCCASPSWSRRPSAGRTRRVSSASAVAIAPSTRSGSPSPKSVDWNPPKPVNDSKERCLARRSTKSPIATSGFVNPLRRSRCCRMTRRLRVVEGQRVQQHRLDDGEERRVGADSQRKSEEGSRGKARLAPEQTHRLAQVMGPHGGIRRWNPRRCRAKGMNSRLREAGNGWTVRPW